MSSIDLHTHYSYQVSEVVNHLLYFLEHHLHYYLVSIVFEFNIFLFRFYEIDVLVVICGIKCIILWYFEVRVTQEFMLLAENDLVDRTLPFIFRVLFEIFLVSFTYLVCCFPQIMLPEAIAIVMAPTDNSRYVIMISFSVTTNMAHCEISGC